VLFLLDIFFPGMNKDNQFHVSYLDLKDIKNVTKKDIKKKLKKGISAARNVIARR
jgi:hypothetical protein